MSMRTIRIFRWVSPMPAWLAAVSLCASLASTNVRAYDDRVALVIGNNAYPTEPLKNAVNDARAVQKTLQDLGFKVVYRPNADITAMRSAAVDFTRMLDGATAAVFYYAGHGIQYRDKNFLVPIDAKLTSEAEIVFNALEVGQILERMEDAKVKYKFIILDACRNNPFRDVFATSGLAKISRVPPGTIISYAAAAGAVAQDGDGDNGLYTKHLLDEIRNPANQATLVFQNVSSLVGQESGGKQFPEFQSVAQPGARPFFFAEGGARAVVTAGTTVSAETNTLIDRDFWNGVKESKKIDDYQIYLDQFPNGVFARLARSKIDNLKQEKSQQQVATAPLSSAPVNAAPVLVPEKTAEVAKTPIQVAATTLSAPLSTSPAAKSPPTVDSAAIKIASAPATSEVRGIEAKPAPPPVAAIPATSSPTQTTQAGLSATLPAAGVPPATAAPAGTQVAAISPDQKSALPPPPVFPKFLTGTIDFRDGARYTGDYKEDKDKNQTLHGKGEYIGKNFRYNGEFKDGKKEGRGVYVWANGDKFDGDFVDEQPSGKGKWEFATGDKYEGDVVKSMMSGKGVLTTKNGDKFDGLFKDNLQHGKGIYTFATGDKFDGVMSMGKMSGPGVYVTKAGDRIEATFAEGTPQGKGIYYFTNGDRYEGDIQGGALTGQGKYYFSNGQRTEGNYINGVLKGEGKFIFGDGSWFEGQFEDGTKRAKGNYYNKDGTKRAADMIDGVVKPIG